MKRIKDWKESKGLGMKKEWDFNRILKHNAAKRPHTVEENFEYSNHHY